MARILIVENDKILRATLERWLTFERHVVETVEDKQAGLEQLKLLRYDLVVLDADMPRGNGLDVLRQFRAAGGSARILLFTRQTGDSTPAVDAGAVATGGDAGEMLDGADAYLAKPFHMKELSVSVHDLLQKARPGDVLRTAELMLETGTFRVARDGEDIQLSQQEFALLEFLMRNANQVFSPEMLLERLWKTSSDVSAEAVHTHIRMLHRKLHKEGEPSLIKNVLGVGYCLERQ